MNTKNIFLIFAFIAIIGFLGLFLFGNNDKTKKPEDTSQHSLADREVGIDKPVYEELTFPNNTLDTSDWEIYKNEEFGFEVKYPEEWGFYVLKKGDLLGLVDKDNSGIEFTKNNSSVGIRIFFSDEPFSLVRQRKIEWIQSGDNGFYKDIIKDSITGIQINQKKESVFGQESYMFDNKKQALTFTNIREDLIFQQILLSFKLIK